MSPSRIAFAATVALLIPVSAAAPGLRFEPAEGSALAKTFERELRLGLDALASTMDGQEVPAQYLPDLDIQVGHRGRVVVRDRYVSIGDGRPRVLERTFEAVEETTASSFRMDDMPEMSSTAEGSSPLEGVTVVFRWDADAGEYETSAAEARVDAGALEGLVEDMDLRGFLPPGDAGELEPGATWDVDAEALGVLFEPGGDLALVMDGWVDEEHDANAFDLEGTLVARLARIEEAGEARIAVVTLSGSLVGETERATNLDHIPVVDGTATEVATTTLEVEGELRWDVGAHRVHALELTCPVETVTVTTKDPGQPGPELDTTLSMTGEWRFRVSAGAP